MTATTQLSLSWEAPPSPPEKQARDYQIAAVDSLRENLARNKQDWQILSAPTGSGKTEVAIEIIRKAVEKGSSVDFICDRQSLVHQTSQRFSEAKLQHGVVMGTETYGREQPIRVSSSQTLTSRGLAAFKRGLDGRDKPHLVIIDECHDLRRKLLDMVKGLNIPVIGLTATPFKSELRTHYRKVVSTITTNKLIADGWLAPIKAVAPTSIIDTHKMAVASNGEFAPQDVTKRTMRIVGDIVPEWKRQIDAHFDGQPQPTIVFAASIDEAEAITKEFTNAGYDFRCISSRTPHQNADIIKAFNKGDFPGIVNVAILTRGFDAPQTRILVDCYPLRKSFTTHIQKIGRLMRSAPGKEFGLLIDHAENWLAFRDQTLDFYKYGLDDIPTGKEKPPKRKKSYKELMCSQCRTIFEGNEENCKACGAPRPRRQPRARVQRTPGNFQIVDEITGKELKYQKYELWERVCTAQLAITPDLERAKRRAGPAYKNLTGNWPGWEFSASGQPDPVVVGLVKRSFRAWAAAQRYKGKGIGEVDK